MKTGNFVDTNTYFSSFYIFTALHGIHLLGGLFFWGKVCSRILKLNGRTLFFTDNKGLAYWGLRHFILNSDFNWEIDMPIDCKKKISTHPVSRYELKALKNNTNPFYFQFIKQ